MTVKTDKLGFLADKSRDFIEKQIASYRQKHANSGTIITVLALFIPFFLNGLDGSFLLIKILSILPIGILLYAIILLIQVLRTSPLDQGFHVDKFDELANKDYDEILIYEIGANKSSFIDNKSKVDKANDKYNLAIKATVVAIIISSLLLLFNEFHKPDSKPTEVLIVNQKIYFNERKR